MENTSEELGGFPIEPQMTYILNVEDDMKPKVGQIFESLDATYKFYNAYARMAGFSVRKSKETKKNGMVYWKKYVCYKEGETDEIWRNNNKVEERDRKNTRTGCDAKLTVYSDGSNYVVKSFKEEHNHSPTTPSRVHLLTSHRTVSTANSLMDFVTRFNRALAYQRHQELIEDHNDLNETPVLKLGKPMEIQMAHLYTKKYFHYFQVQLHDSNSYFVEAATEDDSRCVYKTKRVFAQNRRMRTLVHDKVSNTVTCSCRMFEFEGVPCRHILALLRVKQVMEFPKEYILRRSTRFSRVRRERFQGQDATDNSLIMRHNGMFKIVSKLIDEAAISLEGTELVKKTFEELIEQIKKLNLLVGQEAVNNSINGIYEENRFLDPSQAKTKGSGKRILSWRDRKGKVRHCSVCRSTKHTKQTCTFQRSNVGENDADVAADEEDYVVDEL